MALNESPLLLKYKKQYEKNPKSVVFAPLAELYRKLGFIDRAMEILKDGIRYNPSYYMGYMVMASCYYDQSQFPMAYATLRPIVDNNRDNLRLQNLFANICIELNYLEEALEAYKYILFLNPKDYHAALKVKEIEERIAPSISHTNKKVEIFKEEALEFDPVAEIDSWTQVDFGSRKPAVVEVEEEWVSKPVSEIEVDEFQVDEYEEENEYLDAEDFDQEIHDDQVNEELDNSEIPFLSYTLVDIYCLQQHFSKALEILDKMKKNNPNDVKIDAKINEVQLKLSESNKLSAGAEDDELFSSIKRKMENEQKDCQEIKIDRLNQFLALVKKRKNEISCN